LELTQEQKERLIPLLKMEMGKKAQEITNYTIAKNRYVDLYACEPEENTEDRKRLETSANDYQKIIEIFTKDLELLESIQKELES
jgi:hypothetical protein